MDANTATIIDADHETVDSGARKDTALEKKRSSVLKPLFFGVLLLPIGYFSYHAFMGWERDTEDISASLPISTERNITLGGPPPSSSATKQAKDSTTAPSEVGTATTMAQPVEDEAVTAPAESGLSDLEVALQVELDHAMQQAQSDTTTIAVPPSSSDTQAQLAPLNLSDAEVAPANSPLPAASAAGDSTLALHQKVASLEQQLARAQLQLARYRELPLLFQRYATLKSAILTGDGYKGLVQPLLMMELLPRAARSPLEWLRSVAVEGIDTEPQLVDGFHARLEAFYTDEAAETAGDISAGLWSAVKQNLGSLVTIRKIGASHEGQDDASILARAEVAVEAHDFAEALDELQRLSPEAKAFFAAWRAEAKQAIQLQEVLPLIEDALFTISVSSSDSMPVFSPASGAP